jgi:cellulose synthase/poly-beta-1,6-N-acetylglucosamine synthase-like glycosyltransferase
MILQTLLRLWNDWMVGYFAVLNLIYTVLLVLGMYEIRDYVRRRPFRDLDAVARSRLTLPISIVMPAHNEEPVIVECVRALLAADFPAFEVIVVNDGSRDESLERLREAFALVAVERVTRGELETRPVRAVYASPLDDRIVVVDKENGGKADAINAGLLYASYPIFCCIDSDTLIDGDSLIRLVQPFLLEPDKVVAAGGIVRIANGCTIEDNRVVDVRTPRSLVANLQIVEYLRAFLSGRTGWSRMNALLIISGAFGLFRRDAVVAAGGYDTSTVGEDAELVARLHRRMREARRPYKVVFLADPVCWTQCPDSLRVLARQRNRWHRGLLETMWRHRRTILNPRYGAMGLVAMPYFLVFEALGPAIELTGYVVMAASLAAGRVSTGVAAAFLALALSYGLVLSFGALILEEHAFRRYRRRSCLLKLGGCASLENFGYRQLTTVVRARAFWSMLRGRKGWGEMTRTGFGGEGGAPVVEAEPAPAAGLREAA